MERWYLVAYSEDKEHENDEFRFFGLDRIYDPVLVTRKFIPYKDTDGLRNLFKNKIGISTIKKNQSIEPEEIKLWVGREMANYVKSLPLHHSQKHIDYYSSGDIEVILELIPTLELITLILSYGEHMRVISPECLKKEVKSKLQKTITNY